MKTSQYDNISKNYTVLVKTDPQKNFVQYPAALELLGGVKAKTVLDVGCGSGAFANRLSESGANVVGYDNSAGQIELAKRTFKDVEFVVADPAKFRTTQKFDKAVSVLVLHYATDTGHLEKFFASTFNVLKDGGQFVCILVNPGFKRLGQVVYNRRFSKQENGNMKVDFFDLNQQVSCSAEYRNFSYNNYEQAAFAGGFTRVEWRPLKVSQRGIKKLGETYWSGFEEDCLYIGFIAYK